MFSHHQVLTLCTGHLFHPNLLEATPCCYTKKCLRQVAPSRVIYTQHIFHPWVTMGQWIGRLGCQNRTNLQSASICLPCKGRFYKSQRQCGSALNLRKLALVIWNYERFCMMYTSHIVYTCLCISILAKANAFRPGFQNCEKKMKGFGLKPAQRSSHSGLPSKLVCKWSWSRCKHRLLRNLHLMGLMGSAEG